MTTLDVSQAFRDAQLLGVQMGLDSGSGNAYLLVYNGTKPTTPGDPATGSTLLVTMVLAKPSTIFASPKLTLVQNDPTGDLIGVQGNANWARLMSANDTWLADGAMTDSAGAGPFKISGTTGTLLYAGARAILGLTRWG